MNFETYEKEGRTAYEELARTIRSIIETIGSHSADYRIQQVQSRAKGVSSLRKKLIDNGALESDEIEAVVKDLAGCRVILYTNTDVARFVTSNVIADNFEVNWERTKFHYPLAEPTANDGFISYNYVVRLKDDRLNLPEYAPFAGLWCEVQVQTTLDHAWSEMAHDTIYKRPPPGLGTAVMDGVAERMTEIIQKYLRPAGFEFQKVVADVRGLERARAIVATDPLRRLREAEDNNVRHEILGEFRGHVLRFYDDLPAQADEVRATMIETVLAARATPPQPWSAHGFSFDGIEASIVMAAAVEVINDLRFVSLEAIDATFDALAVLFPGATIHEHRSLNEAVEKLAKHDLHIWQTAGPIVQQRLVALIKGLSPDERAKLRPLVVKTLGHVLLPDIAGVTSTYNAFTIHQGAVAASDELLTIRRDAISILKELFATASEVGDQIGMLHAFEGAGRTPNHGQLTAKLYQATLDDMTDVIAFLADRSGQLPFEFLQKAEHDLLWRYRHTSALPTMFANDDDLEASRQALRSAILGFRDRINTDTDFVIYKTLVGFQSVFPPAWTNGRFDYEGESAYRESEMNRLVGEVSDASFDDWLRIIRRCAQTKSNDGATFPSFRQFLRKLGQARPAILVRLFDHLDEDLDWFVADMLLGLEGGSQEAKIAELTSVWLTEKRHLTQMAAYCDQSKALKEDLLRGVVEKAISADERRAISISMGTCIRRDGEVLKGLGTLFSQALAHFVAKDSAEWIRDVWYRPDLEQFARQLPLDARKSVLDDLVNLRTVDFHAEELLNAVAGDNPAALLDFFESRFAREAAEGGKIDGYEAIPFDFNRLREVFEDHGSEVVSAVRRWFDPKEQAFFQFRGGAFIARLFPDFASSGDALLHLVRTGDEEDVQFVLRVLGAYKGQNFLLPICREIVARTDSESPDLRLVNHVLDEAGVINGEFGLVELYRQRKAEIAPWLDDLEAAVREFAQKRSRQLNLAIAAEQRRSLEELELRKRQYGE